MSSIDPNGGGGGIWNFLMGREEVQEEKFQDGDEVITGGQGDDDQVLQHDPNCTDLSCGVSHGTGGEDFSATELQHTTVCPPNCVHSIATDSEQSQGWSQFFSRANAYCWNPNTDFSSEVDEMRIESPLKRTGSNDATYELVYTQGDGSDDTNA